MWSPVVYIAGLMIFVAFLDNAYAIKCYSCAYPGNDNCNDEFKSTGITIEDNCASCSKLKGEANGHTMIQRQCSMVPASKDECAEVKAGGGTGNGCFCTTDLCNGAAKLAGYPVLVIPALVALMKLF